jgi:hypothetical protein
METQFINLNMTPSGVNPIFHISQYDVGRALGFIVHSGGAIVDLDTYTCTIEATRSDGTAITSAVATTDNIGTFEVTPTMSNKADKYRCQLVIVDENSKRIASLPFDMEVTKAAMDENSEAIEEDASLYQQYTEAVQGAIAEANADIQAEENARIAAVSAEATARANAINAEASARQAAVSAEASTRQTADNNLQNSIASEASTRATTDNSLQSQIDQLIAPSGEAPSAAEVQNARVGANGITYDTLGNAIRTQVGNLENESRDIIRGLTEVSGYVPVVFEQGSVNTNTGEISDSDTRIRSNFVPVTPGTQYTIYLTNNTGVVIGPAVVYYKADGTYLSSKTDLGNKPIGESVFMLTPPTNAYYLRFRYNKASGNINPAEISQTMYDKSSLIDNALVNYGVISRTGLDLNTDDFVHPGMWALADMAYAPAHYPSTSIGRIISFTSSSDSSYSTVQMVFDNVGFMYYRISPANGNWREWVKVANAVSYDSLKANTIYNYGNITTIGLDLNGGDFIHPGMWALNDTQYLPFHTPTNKRFRLISFASSSNNTIFTYQVIVDADNVTYRRFSTNTSVWSPWVCENPYNKLAFKPSDPVCMFEASKHTQADTSNYTMIWGGYENRVSRLISMYDAEANPNGYSISKSSLGKDATGTFDVWLYKVSLGYTNQTAKPVVLLVVGEHGNEPASAMTGYYAYKEIINGALSKYLTYVDFWVVPMMNPYGYEHNTRNNGNDVNLNRDFPANWNYARDGHNDTGDYSMSQPETNYIINLCLQNRNRILFVCNKHDTGAIGRKIAQNEVDTVGYLTTCLYTDSVINESICKYQDQQVKETDPYIVTACTADLTQKQLIVNNSPHPLDGSLDLFLNAVGIHASLLEGSYGWNDGTNVYYDGDVYNNVNYATSQIRYITDFFVNYIAWTIQHSEYLQSSDRAFADYTLKSRKYNESTGEWENITLWYNGSSIVELP